MNNTSQDGQSLSRNSGQRRLSTGPVRTKMLPRLKESQPNQADNLGLTTTDSPSPASESSTMTTPPKPSQSMRQAVDVHSSNSEESEIDLAMGEISPGNRDTIFAPLPDGDLNVLGFEWPLNMVDSSKPAKAKQVKSCCANEVNTGLRQPLVPKFSNLMESRPLDRNTPSQPYDHQSNENVNSPSEFPPKFISPNIPQSWQSRPQQATMYNLPPDYATAREPLNPSQYNSSQYDIDSFSTSLPTNAPYSPVESTVPFVGPVTSLNPAHFCNCGDSCSCLACPVHPYNATTRNHVRDLGQIIYEDCSRFHVQDDSQMSNEHASNLMADLSNMPNQSTSLGEGLSSPEIREFYDSLSLSGQNFDHSELFGGQASGNDPFAFTSNNYYTMEFPLLQDGNLTGCMDVSGACQCLPNECTCPGCLTHQTPENALSDVPESLMTYQNLDVGLPLRPPSEQGIDVINSGPPRTSCCGKA